MADYDNPDFAAVARSLGYDGHTPSSTDELGEILRTLGRPERPTLVNLRVPRDAQYLEIDRWVDGYVQAGRPSEHAEYAVEPPR